VPRLLWRDAQGIEGSLDLANAEIRVGRAMDCAIRTDDAMVSRHHARLRRSGDDVVVEDLGSKNGTWIGGERVHGAAVLADGISFRVGSETLRFERATNSPSTRTVPPADSRT